MIILTSTQFDDRFHTQNVEAPVIQPTVMFSNNILSHNINRIISGRNDSR